MSELRTNRIIPRDGVPAGSFGGGIIQVKFAQLSSQLLLTSNGDILSGNITPIRSDSNILVDIRLRAREESGNNAQWFVGLRKTIGGVDSYPGGRYMMHSRSHPTYSGWAGFYQCIFDQTGGSSQITYTIAAGPWGSNNGTTFRVNSSTGDGETNGAQLIMYEISG
tara:strand:- start:37 stop:534 length:498 start_codon:yes stop_codon:yes gene_type:complete